MLNRRQRQMCIRDRLGISHELRTPLSRMRLQLEFLDNEADRESIKVEIAEMEKIVVSLLEAEKLSARHAPLNRSRINVNDLIEDLVSDFFDRDRGRVKMQVPTGALQANIDDARITLLLKNLIANALRYVSEEGGRVVVSARQQDDDLVLTVEDNGPGMSSGQAEHIGEPFYRGDPSRTRDTGGTGLGLYLAFLVAKAHGGSLRLLNPDQEGARFECRIPIHLT